MEALVKSVQLDLILLPSYDPPNKQPIHGVKFVCDKENIDQIRPYLNQTINKQ